MSEQLHEDVKQNAEEQQEEVNEKIARDINDLLLRLPNSPSVEQREQWKRQFGEIFCLGISEEEIFIFRPIMRAEWVTLQKELRVPPKTEEEQAEQSTKDLEVEEQVVDKCLLWSSAKRELLHQKGGTLSTLYEQVMLNSNFMNPGLASQLVIKL